jgi:hypothetical protein
MLLRAQARRQGKNAEPIERPAQWRTLEHIVTTTKKTINAKIETARQAEEAGLADEEWELTEEEKEQLDGSLEDTFRTGATPLLDALLPEKDWPEEELLDMYRGEVDRRLGNIGAQAVTDDVDDQFYEHVERSFQRGRSEAQCAGLWLTRLS